MNELGNKHNSYAYKEVEVSSKELWALINTLDMVINRYSKRIQLDNDTKGVLFLKGERKYLSDFKSMHKGLNVLYQDTYNYQKCYSSDCYEVEPGEYIMLFNTKVEFNVILKLTFSHINSLLIALGYINEYYSPPSISDPNDEGIESVYFNNFLAVYKKLKVCGNPNKLTIL